MHRVELKVRMIQFLLSSLSEFLMHRVELKGSSFSLRGIQYQSFLMHRVELKAPSLLLLREGFLTVPNAPCGVESI